MGSTAIYAFVGLHFWLNTLPLQMLGDLKQVAHYLNDGDVQQVLRGTAALVVRDSL
jgi:hypothetical protein